jgi:hypothetical protein
LTFVALGDVEPPFAPDEPDPVPVPVDPELLLEPSEVEDDSVADAAEPEPAELDDDELLADEPPDEPLPEPAFAAELEPDPAR